jgi:hypothetical protein
MKRIFTLLLIAIAPLLFSEEQPRQQSSYVKMGVAFPPMPTFGVGTRFQQGKTGFDFSANIDSLLVFNYGEIKGLYLYYPHPEEEHPAYFGIGSGIAYRVNLIQGKGLYSSTTNAEQGTIPLDFVLGREFRQDDCLKTFIQLEISQPLIHFNQHHGKGSFSPRVAATYGMCF